MRTLFLFATLLLAGCGPHFNWREFTSKDAAYQVLFPDKPATASREIDVGGSKTVMTMTAAEVDDIVFAVGHAELGETTAPSAALASMQTALVENIGGTVTHSAAAAASGQAGARITRDIDAVGTRKGQPMRLIAHFEARGRNVYQVVVAGPARAIKPEQSEQFISSFKALK